MRVQVEGLLVYMVEMAVVGRGRHRRKRNRIQNQGSLPAVSSLFDIRHSRIQSNVPFRGCNDTPEIPYTCAESWSNRMSHAVPIRGTSIWDFRRIVAPSEWDVRL